MAGLYRWNNPPNWPSPPPNFIPPPGWQPDPSWPPAPQEWQFWVPTDLPVYKSGWRWPTWLLAVWNGLMGLWLVGYIYALSDECAGEVGAAREACETGTFFGGTIGVTILLVIAAAGNLILGLLWFATRPPQRACPVCGTPAPQGHVVCWRCKHDFRQVQHQGS